MIPEFAKKNDVPETTGKRGYAQNWLLAYLSKLNKIYMEKHRFYDDLDFRLLGDLEADKVKRLISKAIGEAKRKSGIGFDVLYLSKLGLDVSSIIVEKFRFKGIRADFDRTLNRKDCFRNTWKSSLRYQLKIFPDFELVFEDMMKFLGGTF